MTKSSSYDDLALLRTLDPAACLTPRPGAEETLNRIVNSPVDPPQPLQRGVRQPGPRRRGVAGVAVGVAAAAVSFAVLPWTPFGEDRAFATWTGQPTVLTGAERQTAGEQCQSLAGGGAAVSDQAALAEQRGNWTFVITEPIANLSNYCLFIKTNSGTPGVGGMTRVDGIDQPGVDVMAQNIALVNYEDEWVSVISGSASSEVASVSYDSPTLGRVSASVSGDQFALWLPTDDLRSAKFDGAAVPVEVTLRDGTKSTIQLTQTG